MLTFSRTLKTSIVLTGISAFAAMPAAAQDEPPPVPLEERRDIAPAEVELEEEGEAQPPPPAQPAQPPAEEGAQAGAEAGAQVGAEAAPTVTVGAEAPAAEEEAVIVGISPVSHRGVDVGQGDWEFGYHGWFRAPMRIGIGTRDSAAMGLNEDDYSTTTLHRPLVPDDQYLSWQLTNHSFTDWAEMFFSVGNPYARGVLGIEGYNFAQGGWSAPEMQFGISQAYVEIMPELPYENVRMNWRVGAVWGSYGEAGRWDAGEYNTYLFGRTTGMGETLRGEIDIDSITLALEHGIATKRPDPSQYNAAKFTLLNHAHSFIEWEGLMAGLHFLHAWSQEEDREGVGAFAPGPASAPYAPDWADPGSDGGGYGYISQYGLYAEGAEGAWQLPDGSMTIIGAEVKYDAGPYGLGYLGFAHMNAKNALTVANVVTWLHADGGAEFNMGVTNNYLDNPRCEATAPLVAEGLDPAAPYMTDGAYTGCSSRGTGNVNAILFQYEFSVANLLQGLEDGTTFWGEGMDFNTRVYAMYNQVKSDYNVAQDWFSRNEVERDAAGNPILDAAGNRVLIDNYSDHYKLKFGIDAIFSAFPAVGFGTRFDHLRPNSNIAEQSFSILSPRLIFKSRWITRETIMIQYSRYFYQKRQCDLDPLAPNSLEPPVTGQYVGYRHTAGGNEGAFGSLGNFSGIPNDQRCVQYPSAPLQPEGWGAISMQNEPDSRGAPVAGGNPNNVRPDVNVIQIIGQMWW